MNKDFNKKEKDSGTTEEVVLSREDAITELIAQNKKTLELLERQQRENGILLKRLEEEKTTNGGQTKANEKSPLAFFKNIECNDDNFEQFLQVLQFRFKTLGIESDREKLDILLGKLSAIHLDIWQSMEEKLQSDYKEVIKQLKRVFGRKESLGKREFWFLKQLKEEDSLHFAQRIWGMKGQIEGISAQDAIEVIRIGCHYKVADKLLTRYSDIDKLMEDIEKIQCDLKLREESSRI